jgi:hypothetical protein
MLFSVHPAVRLVLSCVFLSALSILSHSCKEDDEEEPAPVITGVSPDRGSAGTEVTITGSNFHTTASGNVVKFNGIAATVSNNTTSTLLVQIPEGATTGPLTVTVNNSRTATFSEFTVLMDPPVMESFDPVIGKTGTTVVITGSDFSSIPANNHVKFNGADAVVTEATSSSLKVTVPTNASTGKVSVTVNGVTTISATDFTVRPHLEKLEPSFGTINSIVTITGSGFVVPATSNIVSFNGSLAEVISGTSTTLSVKVLPGTTTGVVNVTSGGNTTEGPIFRVVIEAIHAGGPGYESGYAVAVDVEGNSYVGGSFQGQVTFGSTVLTATSEDGFLAKYDPEGKLVWVKQVTGQYNERVVDVAVDNQGNIYAAGYISSSDTRFGSLTASSLGTDGFVARLDATGEPKWLKTFGGSGTDMANQIDIDNSSAVFVTGQFFGTMTIGATTLISEGATDVVVAKYNADTGSPHWAKQFGGTSDDNGVSIKVVDDGMYVSGSFFGTFEMAGMAAMASRGELDGFVARLDLSGVAQWVKQIGGANWDNALAVAADETGNCIVGGYFINSATLGTTTLNGIFNEDIFLSKLSSGNGTVMWAKSAGGSDYDNLRSIDVDNSGNIYVTGHYARTATFDNVTIQSASSTDVFVARYAGTGSIDFVKHAGGGESDFGQSVAVDADGIIHVTGSFRAFNVTFGVSELVNAGNDDMFLWKILPGAR